ncbi:OsmC family protein [Mycobacterium ostraviense]|nr:OsmC family protein [Mycobacterium ostraviense]UGT94533.1 OsmC family protein [Mycobacterium ostraviense]
MAQRRGIQLRSVRATVEAGEDLLGILGADPTVRNGFSGIKVTYRIDADATADEIRALVAQSQKDLAERIASYRWDLMELRENLHAIRPGNAAGGRRTAGTRPPRRPIRPLLLDSGYARAAGRLLRYRPNGPRVNL